MATDAVGKNMERIWVMHMIDPETFWFVGAKDEVFRKEKDESLTEVMKNQDTTSNGCQLYTPVVGQLVAVLNPGTTLWQRAEVQEVTGPSGDQCYIFLVDHGIAVTVPASMIRPIPEEADILCDRSTFRSSRLRLRGLSPITTEISSDSQFKPKLTATSEWDTSAFEFVSNLFHSAGSCYMPIDVESYSYVDEKIVGELYLDIKGELVSVIDELVGKNYAGRKSDPQQDVLNYKNDPNCLSLGPNLRDKRQASNPMGIQISIYSLQQAQESEDFDEEIGGLAIKRIDRSYLLYSTIDKSSADFAQNEMATNIQFFPAGLNVSSLPRTIPAKSPTAVKLSSVTSKSCELPNQPKHSLADVPKSVTQPQSASKVVESKESILTAHTRRLKELLKIVDVVPDVVSASARPEVDPSKDVHAAASPEVNSSKVLSAAARSEVNPSKVVSAAASPEVNPSKVVSTAASLEVNPSKVVSAAASTEVNPSKDVSVAARSEVNPSKDVHAAASLEVNPRVAKLSQRLLKSMIKSKTGKLEANVPNQEVEQKLKPTENVVVEAGRNGTFSDAVVETVTTKASLCPEVDPKQKARRRSDKVLEQIRARAQKIDVSAGASLETAALAHAVGVSPSKTESPKLEVHVSAGNVLETSSNTASPASSPTAFKFENLMAGLKKLIEEEDKINPLNVD